jgi:hypothetical protein
MLIEHDRVSIWIHENHVSWTGTGGIRFRRNGKARSFEPTLQISPARVGLVLLPTFLGSSNSATACPPVNSICRN